MSQRIEEGIYKGRAIAGSEQYGSTSNNHDQIVLNLLLETGHEVSTFLVFSEKAAPYSMKRLRALGWQGTDLANLEGIDANDVDVEIRYEEYQGEMKMKVQIVTGGSVTLENQFDDKGKKAFAAKFAALAKTTAPSGGRPAPARPQQRPAPSRAAAPPQSRQATGTGDRQPGDDSDIPF